MKIHAHGLTWNDADQGLWTTQVELFGKNLTAYAIEVSLVDDVWEPVHNSGDTSYRWTSYQEASWFGTILDPVVIGDMTCVVYIVSH